MSPVGSSFAKRFVNPHREGSFVANRRRQRSLDNFARFRKLQERLGADRFRILDVGGALGWWRPTFGQLDASVEITLLNLDPVELADDAPPQFRVAVGDGCDLGGISDGGFDLVFSNSTIEHAGSFHRRMLMAQEIRRIARHGYLVQAPAHYFPLDPHSGLPLFHLLPARMRASAISRWDIRYYPSGQTFYDNLLSAQSTLMPTRREMADLFPEARIEVEHLAGLPKSFSAAMGLD